MPLRSLVTKFLNVVRTKGIKETAKELWKIRRVKPGLLKGVDGSGNKYFEGLGENHIRHRWVVYSASKPDASIVPPPWHKWLHHMTDEAPSSENPVSEEAFSQEEQWLKPHQENQTWTNKRYLPPGSLFRPKPKEYLHYEPWSPKK